MKILSISNLPIWMWGEGKGIPSLYYPHREFVRKGHEVHFVSVLKEGESPQEEQEGIRFHRFDFPFNFRKPVVYFSTDTLWRRIRASFFYNMNWLFFQVFAWKEGQRVATAVSPDIVYAHTLMSVFPAWMVSRRVKAKLVIRVYGTRQLYWRRKNLFWRIKEFRDYLCFRVPADHFIFTRDGNRGDELALEMGVPASRIKSWRNGIDEEMFLPVLQAKQQLCASLGVAGNSRLIVSTARLIPDYGVNRLLEACQKYFVMDPHCFCVIAGGGPEEQSLRDLTEQLKISDRVFFLGVVDRNMIRTILSAGDIFVLPARYHNCTNTVWEAMAAGQCIVTTDNPAIRDVLRPGENAVLVDAKQWDDLTRILSDLFNEPEQIRQFKEAARKTARHVLDTWEQRCDKELAVLEGLIEKGSGHEL